MRFSALYIFLAIVFAVPLAFGLVIKAVDYYQEATWEAPSWPPPTERIQHPDHIRWGEAALNRINALSTDERSTIVESITGNIARLDDWMPLIQDQGYDLLCFGENHDDYIRRFASLHIFDKLKFDILLLEAMPDELEDILDRIDSGDKRVELLNADLIHFITAVRNTNPRVEIFGIEESEDQKKKRQAALEGGRETSIENNLRNLYQPGKRHVILFGAFHCANTWNWLYYRLKLNPGKLTGAETRSIRIVREHIEGSIESFTWFLDEIGVAPKEHFVIKDNASLPQEIKDWFPFLQANELGISESMVVFRP